MSPVKFGLVLLVAMTGFVVWCFHDRLRGAHDPANVLVVLKDGRLGETPIRAGLHVFQAGRLVTFSLWLQDSLDNPALAVLLKGESKPLRPTVEVYDSAGKMVYQDAMDYDERGACRHSWQMPHAVRGKLTARVRYEEPAVRQVPSAAEFTAS